MKCALTYNQKSASAVYDGLDATAALRAAISDAIKDGAIQGVRAGTQALLKSGKDIEAQLKKAMDFEGVFTSLKEYTDPVGAALDTLDKRFSTLSETFKEAGASAAEFTDLEKLYNLERTKAIKASMEQVAGSLTSLLKDLTIGNATLSLRDREAAAREAYNPLATRVAAGDVTAFDDFAQASKDLMDIGRQLYGSQSGYFAVMTDVKSLSESALAAQKVVADAAMSRDNPLNPSGTVGNDNALVVKAIADQTDRLAAIAQASNTNLGTIISLLSQKGIAAPALATGTDGYW